MADFDDFDVEIENSNESDPEHFTGSVTTAGVPVVITPTSGRPIRHMIIECNGVRHSTASNNINDVIKYSIDGTTTYGELAAGEARGLPGNSNNIQLDTNTDGTNYTVLVWS